LQEAGCALPWCYPIKNVTKKTSIFLMKKV